MRVDISCQVRLKDGAAYLFINGEKAGVILDVTRSEPHEEYFPMTGSFISYLHLYDHKVQRAVLCGWEISTTVGGE